VMGVGKALTSTHTRPAYQTYMLQMVRLAAIVSLVQVAWPFPKKPSTKAVNIIKAVVAFVAVAILLNV
jgi:hypothetical protein